MTTQFLQFLRPSACQWSGVERQAYRRFYDAARQHGAASCATKRGLATTTSRGKLVVEESQGLVDQRSAAVARRCSELSRAGAMDYPRIQKSTAMSMRIPTFREKYLKASKGQLGDEVVLHGRVQSVRRMGKLVFVDVTGEFEHVQAMCSFDTLDPSELDPRAFKALFKVLQRGDLVSVTGRATRSQTDELTLSVTRLPQLLSPGLVPLPFKLVDEDAKIHNRHIDMLVNRETVDVLRLRSYIMKYMRDFLHEKGFLEFQTPILAGNAGGAVARPFTTTSPYFRGEQLALRIAPELWLKRLVIGGVEKVFEMGPAFRNEGIDLSHNPEFTICEFYNAYASLPDLISQTEELISGLAHHCQDLISTKLTSLPPIDLSKYQRPFKQVEFMPTLTAALGFDLPDLNTDTARVELIRVLQTNGVPLAEFPHLASLSLPKILDKLAADYLEPFSAAGPLFITHHPACMSPLSKSFICPTTNQLVSARTELFVNERELANMYEEENDPLAQRHKFGQQASLHRDTDTGEGAVADESYAQALESGLPPTGGWGCGVERLVMLFSGARRISDTLSFGHLRNVVGLGKRSTKTAS